MGPRRGFVGINIYNAASRGECWDDLSDDDRFDKALKKIDDAGVHINAIRVHMFQSMLSKNGKEEWEIFDKVVAAAKKHQKYLFPVLENQWPDCSNHYKTLDWYQGKYKWERTPDKASPGPTATTPSPWSSATKTRRLSPLGPS